MKKYYRFKIGRDCEHTDLFRMDGFVGVNFEIDVDLSDSLCENEKDFVSKFIPVWMKNKPGQSEFAAKLACVALWKFAKEPQIGDIIILPSRKGFCYVGTVASNYYYAANSKLPHRIKVEWNNKVIFQNEMSLRLNLAISSFGKCNDVTQYASELEALIVGC